jgi:glucose-1-phosphate cytidylyltransferase
MKVAILAGGRGTRLTPETDFRPKPMVEVGGRPLLWHIMHHYARCGHEEFVIALGFLGDVIKRYIVEYGMLNGSLKVDFRTQATVPLGERRLDWRVELVETGLEALTGARLRRLAPHLRGGTFMLTYGDGVSDVDLEALLTFHRSHGRLATLTAVHPPARFGHLAFEGDRVVSFSEKPQIGEGWINGGFFVFEPGVLDLIPEGERIALELHVLPKLAADGELRAYRHQNFWQCMDTPRDQQLLESLWQSGKAPWKTW